MLSATADGDLGLSEPYVSTDQAVHRAVVLHVDLDVGRRFHLVRRVFIDEAGFQFVLHEAVRAVSKAFFLLAFGVE